jgi:putative phosphoesterase
MQRIGLISDTHGLLRPEALDFLRGADHLIHAGDIGPPRILEALRRIAPVTAVRGNNDVAGWDQLGEDALVQFEGVVVLVIHDLNDIRCGPLPPAARVVVSGHSHKPSMTERDGVLYVNPGSAGPRRFRLPVAVGELIVEHDRVSARVRELDLVAGAKR